MYTHKFEIVLNGYTIEGEITFTPDVLVKYDIPLELPLEQMERINIFFKSMKQLNYLGDMNIKKIELNEIEV